MDTEGLSTVIFSILFWGGVIYGIYRLSKKLVSMGYNKPGEPHTSPKGLVFDPKSRGPESIFRSTHRINL